MLLVASVFFCTARTYILSKVTRARPSLAECLFLQHLGRRGTVLWQPFMSSFSDAPHRFLGGSEVFMLRFIEHKVSGWFVNIWGLF